MSFAYDSKVYIVLNFLIAEMMHVCSIALLVIHDALARRQG